MGAWADICVYKNTCWDGKAWYFFEAGGMEDWKAASMFMSRDDMVRRCSRPLFIIFTYNDTCVNALQLEGVMFPVNPVPPDTNARFPFNGGA